MKKLLFLVLVVLLIAAVPAVALADTGETVSVTGILIENAVEIATAFLIAIIGVFGAWLTARLGKITQLKTVNAAQQEVIKLAQQTVGELQQTVVDGLKAAHSDGKLTKDEIASLSEQLLDKTVAKMSVSAGNVLTAAKVDISALITGAAEQLISVWREDN